MAAFPQFIKRPGVYHPMALLSPHNEEQARWFDATCNLVEDFVEFTEPERDPRRLENASLSVHLLADVLYDRLGKEAHWARISHRDITTLTGSLQQGDSVVGLRSCARFYTFLGIYGHVSLRTATGFAKALKAASKHPSSELHEPVTRRHG